MDRKFPALLVFVFLLLNSCSSMKTKRTPAQVIQEHPNALRIATRILKKGKPDEHQWIILGIDKRADDLDAYPYDLKSLGFEGEGLDSVDPMFLIKVTKEGVRDLRSFELGGYQMWPKDSPVYKEGSWEQERFSRLTPEDLMTKSALPPEFMDTPRAKLWLLTAAATDFLISTWAMGSIQAAPIAAVINYVRKQLQLELEQEADGLRAFIELEKIQAGTFPGLRRALAYGDCNETCVEDRLNQIGGSVAYRYNQDDPYYTLILKPSHEIPDFFEASLNRHVSKARDNIALLNQFMARLGPEYKVVPVGTRYVFVFIDAVEAEKREIRQKTHRDRKFDKKIVETAEPKEILDFYKTLSASKHLPPENPEYGRYIPLCFFSLDSSRPLQLVDFNAPGKIRSQQRIAAVITALKEMGITMTPFQGALAIRIIDGVTTFVLHKQGKTYTDFRFRPNAQARAILESKAVGFDPHEVSIAAFFQILQQWGVDQARIDQYRQKVKTIEPQEIVGEAMGFKPGEMRKFVEPYKPGLQDREPVEVFKVLEDMVLDMLNKESDLQGFLSSPFKSTELRRNNKMINIRRFENWLRNDYRTTEKRDKRESRMIATSTGPESPVIAFLADGVRPDRLQEEANKCITGEGRCLIPTITDHFFRNGRQAIGYSSRSLTLPSWTTILTGYEPDEHGILSNTPATRTWASRKSFETDKGTSLKSNSYLDIRKDLIPLMEGRVYKRLKASGVNWLGRNFYGNEEFSYNFMPLTDDEYPPVARLTLAALTNIPDIATGVVPWAAFFDEAQTEKTAAAIRRRIGKKNQYKVVVAWLSAIDAFLHHRGDSIDLGWKSLDKSVKTILDAAMEDPTLKDARIMLVSDHGHLGGPNPADDLFDKPYFLNNTSLNLTEFFGGDIQGYAHYPFVVFANESPTPDLDLNYLHEIFLHPFSYIYRGHKNHAGGPNVMVDYSGDNLAQIYFKHPTRGWNENVSFYEMSNYPAPTGPLNIPEDLLKFTIPIDQLNIAMNDFMDTKRLKEKLKDLTGLRPVRMIAVPLRGANAKASVAKIANATFNRDPILVRTYKGGDQYLNGIILSRSQVVPNSNTDEFRYFPIENFSQALDGTVGGKITKSASRDPLGYVGKVSFNPNSWYTDREWISLAKNHLYPTVVFGLARVLTLSPRVFDRGIMTAETATTLNGSVPDLVLVSNRGFNFNSGFHTQSDHGGFTKDEVLNTVFISGLGNRKPSGFQVINTPVLTRDIAPTILDFTGRYIPETMPGRSFKNGVE